MEGTYIFSQQSGGGGPSGGLLAHPLSWLSAPASGPLPSLLHLLGMSLGSQTGIFNPDTCPLNLRGQPVAGLRRTEPHFPAPVRRGCVSDTTSPKIQCLGDSVGSGNPGQTPSPQHLHLDKSRQREHRGQLRDENGVMVGTGLRRATEEPLTNWDVAGKDPGWAGGQPQGLCRLSSQGHQGVQSQGEVLVPINIGPGRSRPTSPERSNPALWALGRNQLWQVLHKHLLKSRMP